MKRVIVLIMAFSSAWSGHAQDCRQMVKASLDKMKPASAKVGAGIRIGYDVAVHTTEGSSYSDKIDLSVYGEKVRVSSNDVTVYQDSKTVVMIHSSSHVVMMTRPTGQVYTKDQLDRIVNMNDSLFNSMLHKSCSDDPSIKSSNGLASKKVVFQLPDALRKKFPISEATYWIDTREQNVKKIHMVYDEDAYGEVAAITIDLTTLNYGFASAPFEGSALAKVMNGEKDLKKEYHGYTLIDKR